MSLCSGPPRVPILQIPTEGLSNFCISVLKIKIGTIVQLVGEMSTRERKFFVGSLGQALGAAELLRLGSVQHNKPKKVKTRGSKKPLNTTGSSKSIFKQEPACTFWGPSSSTSTMKNSLTPTPLESTAVAQPPTSSFSSTSVSSFAVDTKPVFGSAVLGNGIRSSCPAFGLVPLVPGKVAYPRKQAVATTLQVKTASKPSRSVSASAASHSDSIVAFPFTFPSSLTAPISFQASSSVVPHSSMAIIPTTSSVVSSSPTVLALLPTPQPLVSPTHPAAAVVVQSPGSVVMTDVEYLTGDGSSCSDGLGDGSGVGSDDSAGGSGGSVHNSTCSEYEGGHNEGCSHGKGASVWIEAVLKGIRATGAGGGSRTSYRGRDAGAATASAAVGSGKVRLRDGIISSSQWAIAARDRRRLPHSKAPAE